MPDDDAHPEPSAKLLRQLTTRRGDATGGAPESADLGSALEKIDHLHARLSGPGTTPPAVTPEVRQEITADAYRALAKLQTDGPRAKLSLPERFALEAVIIADGTRPVLFVTGVKLLTEGVDLGEFASALRHREGQISSAIPAVGRIGVRQSRHRYAGTGFVVGDDLVMTNRHVLQVIGIEDNGAWSIYPEATIDFHGERRQDGSKGPTDLYTIEEVVFAGPEPVSRIDPCRLDLALLRIRKTKPSQPKRNPLRLSTSSKKLRMDAPIYVLGYPQAADVFYGHGTPEAGTETAEVMSRLFADEFGVKRLAPGYVDVPIGETEDCGKQWVFEHDASTLGGNSGSAVLDLSDGATAVGLHFGGGPRRANYAHALAALQNALAGKGVNYAG